VNLTGVKTLVLRVTDAVMVTVMIVRTGKMRKLNEQRHGQAGCVSPYETFSVQTKTFA